MHSTSFGACCPNRVNHGVILLPENCAQIELETRVRDIADDWWTRIPQAGSEIGQRTIRGNNVDRD